MHVEILCDRIGFRARAFDRLIANRIERILAVCGGYAYHCAVQDDIFHRGNSRPDGDDAALHHLGGRVCDGRGDRSDFDPPGAPKFSGRLHACRIGSGLDQRVDDRLDALRVERQRTIAARKAERDARGCCRHARRSRSRNGNPMVGGLRRRRRSSARAPAGPGPLAAIGARSMAAARIAIRFMKPPVPRAGRTVTI